MNEKKIRTFYQLSEAEKKVIIYGFFKTDPMLCVCSQFAANLDEHGTVTVNGTIPGKPFAKDEWHLISRLVNGRNHIVGLRSDGSLVACGDNSCGQCEVSAYKNVSNVKALHDGTVLVQKDGSLVTLGNTDASAVQRNNDQETNRPEKQEPQEEQSEKNAPEPEKAASTQAAVSRESDFKTNFSLFSDYIHIIGYRGTDENVIIPSVIRGKKVLSVRLSFCKKITSITIPDSVMSIGESAFSFCENLTSIKIPDSVKRIDAKAFLQCHNLTSIKLPKGFPSIGNSTFYKCYNLKSITIPQTVRSIDKCAFYECTSLKSVTIPKGVTGISALTFYKCTGLTSVTIPSSVTSIGDSAFEKCTSLKSITIPNSVNDIGYHSFASCKALSKVTMEGNAPRLDGSAFKHCDPNLTFYVPRRGIGYEEGKWVAFKKVYDAE